MALGFLKQSPSASRRCSANLMSARPIVRRVNERIGRHVPTVLAGLLVLGALAWPFLQRAEAPPQENIGPTPGTTPVHEDPPVGLTPAHVTIESGRLLVDGAASPILRCVRYQPTPVGVDIGHGYKWAHYPGNYEGDLPLLASMGTNTLAVNSRSGATQGELTEFMSRALDHGMRVVLAVDGPNSEDPADPAVQQAFMDHLREVVTHHRTHPALLAWQIGNEVDYSHRRTPAVDAWYALLENATREVHALDGNHPVLTGNNPVTSVSAFRAGSPSVDVYGINFYGLTTSDVQGYLTNLAERAEGYAILVTEFGVDAFDSLNMTEDEETQARHLGDAWLGIQAAHDAGVPVLGGCIHEWSDQWWKGGANDGHDPEPSWPIPDEGVIADGTFSEEWFGIVGIRPGSNERDLRLAYQRMRDLWAPA